MKARTVTEMEKIQRHFSVLLENRDRRTLLTVTRVLKGREEGDGGVLIPSEDEVSRSVTKLVWEFI
jgi:hypothetical protein